MNTLIRFAPTAARLVLGLIFAIFGLNGFLHFIPIPPAEGAAGSFMGGLAATGYFFPMLALTQVFVGAALLLNFLAPLALVVLAPITVHIFAYHTLVPDGFGMAVLIVVLHVGLAWHLRESYRPLFINKVTS